MTKKEFTRQEQVFFYLMLILCGPLGVFTVFSERDARVFLWGVGTTLLYAGVIGFLETGGMSMVMEKTGLRLALHQVSILGSELWAVSYPYVTSPTMWLIVFAFSLSITVPLVIVTPLEEVIE